MDMAEGKPFRFRLFLPDARIKAKPDMIILDISVPRLRGLEAACEIKKIHPNIKILFLTMQRDQGYLLKALDDRADGYLLKEDTHIENRPQKKSTHR